VALPKKLVKALQARDSHCWHCGADGDVLVPHHRKNRGAGGSKLLDTLDNVVLVCAAWNGLMESDAASAEKARQLGHKLRSWQDVSEPIFDNYEYEWYVLTPDGDRIVVTS